MLTTLLDSLEAILETISGIQEVYSYPLQGNPNKYPAIIFYPDTVDNAFETTNENFKIYTFKIFVVINIAGKTVEDVWTGVLPKTIDSVTEKIDESWNMGTVGGHRVWARLSTNQIGMSIEEKSKTATVEMTLQVKTLTDN